MGGSPKGGSPGGGSLSGGSLSGGSPRGGSPRGGSWGLGRSSPLGSTAWPWGGSFGSWGYLKDLSGGSVGGESPRSVLGSGGYLRRGLSRGSGKGEGSTAREQQRMKLQAAKEVGRAKLKAALRDHDTCVEYILRIRSFVRDSVLTSLESCLMALSGEVLLGLNWVGIETGGESY